MTLVMPRPEVPYIDTYGILDLDLLQGRALDTVIEMFDAPLGQYLHPLWRATLANGTAADIFTPPRRINDPHQYVALQFQAEIIQALDQGLVYFSYSIQPTGTYEEGQPESVRTAFMVGRRDFPGSGMDMMVVREAHQQQFNYEDVGSAGAAVTVLPWQAMHTGDQVTLNWRGFGPAGREYPFQQRWEVEDVHLERQLAMTIPVMQLMLADGGWGILNYWVDYVGGGHRTVSPTQRFELQPAPQGRLAPLRILEHAGDVLDPDTFSASMTYDIEPYAGMQEGDVLVIYAQAGISTSRPVADAGSVQASSPLLADLLPARPLASVRLDLSSIHSSVLHCVGSSSWIEEYLDHDVTLTCHVARPGMALASQPLTLPVVKSMLLPPPVVEGASGAGGNAGEFRAEFTGTGIKVRVPSLARYPANASIEMHWAGFGEAGSEVVSNGSGVPLTFIINPAAIMPNLGRAVQVFYRITPQVGPARDSVVFSLNILTIPENRYPLLHCVEAVAGTLQLSKVPAAGAYLSVAPWILIARGQWVDMQAVGTHKSTGLAVTLQVLDAHPVTVREESSGLGERLNKSWLADLQHNSLITLTVRVSADGGETYVLFPRVYITIDTLG